MRPATMLTMALLLAVPASGSPDRGKIVQFAMGGDIRLDSAPDGARVRTMGGDIVIKRASGRVVAKTMGGDIEIRQVDGSLEAGTMGGSIDVEVIGSATGRDIQIGTMGGNIEVTFPRDSRESSTSKWNEIPTTSRCASTAISLSSCGSRPRATSSRSEWSSRAPAEAAPGEIVSASLP